MPEHSSPYVAVMFKLDAFQSSNLRCLRAVREKFLEIVHDQRDKLFNASHDERAAFVKKAFDKTIRR